MVGGVFLFRANGHRTFSYVRYREVIRIQPSMIYVCLPIASPPLRFRARNVFLSFSALSRERNHVSCERVFGLDEKKANNDSLDAPSLPSRENRGGRRRWNSARNGPSLAAVFHAKKHRRIYRCPVLLLARVNTINASYLSYASPGRCLRHISHGSGHFHPPRRSRCESSITPGS